jgi:PAS domain S-box-containing protein
MKILLAGSKDSGDRMQALLKTNGHQSIRVADGLAALDRLRKEPFDAVIAESRMPLLDGWELCVIVRADLRLEDPPVVLVVPEGDRQAEGETAKRLEALCDHTVPPRPEEIINFLEGLSDNSDRQGINAKGGRGTEMLDGWLLEKLEKKARQLQQSMKKARFFRTAVDHASEMVAVTDDNGTIEYVNPAFENITGFTQGELIGSNPRILKSGRQDRQFYHDLWQTITRGVPWRGFFVNRRKDGSYYREEAQIVPIADSDGTSHGYVAVKRDVTQENQLQRQLIQSQKMEAIGTLAGGIAHDFNNILSAILGFAELALFDLAEGSRSHEDVSEVIKAGNRAKDLVRQILTFSRKTEQEFKPIDIVPLLNEALKFLRATLPSTIEIDTRLNAENAEVLCNPTMIQQILMNLCTNAAQAMKETGGTLTVNLSEIEVDIDGIGKQPQMPPGPYLRLTVSDTGPGIEPGHLGRIFDPYFTTKEKGEGTGLGLSVVHGIIQSLKGTVSVDSTPDQGTAFNVYLPRVIGVPDSSVHQPQSLPTGSERILLADDEDALATMGRLMLGRLGYRVTVKTDSCEALEAFRSAPDQFDLIISDKTMPRLTGFDLAEEVKKIRPEMPIIICTGYSDETETEKAVRLGISRLVVKPLSLDDLAGAVRSALDSAAGGRRRS